MSSEYHGIIVKEGVRDISIFQNIRVLSRQTGKDWTLMKVGVSPKGINKIISSAQTNLVIENGIPYYAHFYRDNELIVVFPSKVFRITPDRATWGESLGIARKELDFRPCWVEDETY
jgi:hypothetical protein